MLGDTLQLVFLHLSCSTPYLSQLLGNFVWFLEMLWSNLSSLLMTSTELVKTFKKKTQKGNSEKMPKSYSLFWSYTFTKREILNKRQLKLSKVSNWICIFSRTILLNTEACYAWWFSKWLLAMFHFFSKGWQIHYVQCFAICQMYFSLVWN